MIARETPTIILLRVRRLVVLVLHVAVKSDVNAKKSDVNANVDNVDVAATVRKKIVMLI